jgi:hypothetical protein
MGEAGKPIPPGQGYYSRRGRFRKLKVATPQTGALTLNTWIEKIGQRAPQG